MGRTDGRSALTILLNLLKIRRGDRYWRANCQIVVVVVENRTGKREREKVDASDHFRYGIGGVLYFVLFDVLYCQCNVYSFVYALYAVTA